VRPAASIEESREENDDKAIAGGFGGARDHRGKEIGRVEIFDGSEKDSRGYGCDWDGAAGHIDMVG